MHTPPPTQDRILAALQARPGATVADLARTAGVDHSTATYHVARLEAEGRVVVERHARRLFCFLNGQATRRERALAIAARRDRTALILAALGPLPRPLGHVARGLPMTRAGVHWHLLRLAALGLVVVEGPPRARTYRLPGQGEGGPPQLMAAAAQAAC